jgi:hypothetical protein
MTAGDRVMIYALPATCEYPEGWATLICKTGEWKYGLEEWNVRFDDLPDKTFTRPIKIQEDGKTKEA